MTRFALTLLLTAACGSPSEPADERPDAGPSVVVERRPVAPPDAGAPDTMPTAPDVTPVTPDVMPITPDAAPAPTGLGEEMVQGQHASERCPALWATVERMWPGDWTRPDSPLLVAPYAWGGSQRCGIDLSGHQRTLDRCADLGGRVRSATCVAKEHTL